MGEEDRDDGEEGAGEDLSEPGEAEPSLTGASNISLFVSEAEHFSERMKSMPNDILFLFSMLLSDDNSTRAAC